MTITKVYTCYRKTLYSCYLELFFPYNALTLHIQTFLTTEEKLNVSMSVVLFCCLCRIKLRFPNQNDNVIISMSNE